MALKFPNLSEKVNFLSHFSSSFPNVKLLQATEETESQKERAQSSSLRLKQDELVGLLIQLRCIAMLFDEALSSVSSLLLPYSYEMFCPFDKLVSLESL